MLTIKNIVSGLNTPHEISKPYKLINQKTICFTAYFINFITALPITQFSTSGQK